LRSSLPASILLRPQSSTPRQHFPPDKANLVMTRGNATARAGCGIAVDAQVDRRTESARLPFDSARNPVPSQDEGRLRKILLCARQDLLLPARGCASIKKRGVRLPGGKSFGESGVKESRWP
jgi:hypothetical protein